MQPGFGLGLPELHRLLQPEVIMRQIECTAASGNTTALKDAFQEFVAAHRAADLAVDGKNPVGSFRKTVENKIQPFGIDTGSSPNTRKFLPLTIEFFYQVRLDVRSREYVDHIQQCINGRSAAPGVGVGQIVIHLTKQMLQTQQCAHLLVQRMLIGDFVRRGGWHDAPG